MAKVWLVVSIIGFIALLAVGYFAITNVSAPKLIKSQASETNACPNQNNSACFDCNEDGQVNILDFSCFSNVYGEEY